MTLTEQLITIGVCVLGTMLTRFIPFIIFSSSKPTPNYIQYLGKVLPSALFGMLIIYSLKDISIVSGNRGIPELISIICVIVIHLWKRNMLLSTFTGTAFYMILIQLVF